MKLCEGKIGEEVGEHEDEYKDGEVGEHVDGKRSGEGEALEEENKEEVLEKSNPNSNRFLTSCFLTLARPKKKEDERSRGGGRAKEALCLEVSSACPPGTMYMVFFRLAHPIFSTKRKITPSQLELLIHILIQYT